MEESLKAKVRHLPNNPGVYLMRDQLGKIIYVGKAKNLKKRVSSYFRPLRGAALTRPKLKALISLIKDLDYIIVKSEKEALVLEDKLVKQWQPKFNQDLKDDSGIAWIRVDSYSLFPSFRIAYNRSKDMASLYFGPFIHKQFLRLILRDLRLRFGVLLGDTQPKKISDTCYHLYQDARAEIYAHPNEVDVAGYKERVEAACEFLKGKAKAHLQELNHKMALASEKQAFEEAAKLRDLCRALEDTLNPSRKFVHLPQPKNQQHLTSALVLLQKELSLSAPPHVIECFDISHISGTFVVASMVSFVEGKPHKANYRRFKIKSFIGNDDYRAMEEVVARRYQKIIQEGRPLPDLIVIDGGLGQLRAALKAFNSIQAQAPCMIGLAKKKETLIFLEPPYEKNLPLTSPALNLLQRLRDEAHRFANAFNADLRSKAIQSSLLDDCPGLGPAKKRLLLHHFKTIQAIKKASFEELASLKSIGPRLAEAIFTTLGKAPPSSALQDPLLER